MTIANIMRLYGNQAQIIDSEYASDKAQILAMGLYIKDLEAKLDMESGGEFESRSEGAEIPVLSWADFLGLGREMRAAQRRYFKTRLKDDLIRSKCLEKAFDGAVAKIEAERSARRGS
jgi:hypothetical protein